MRQLSFHSTKTVLLTLLCLLALCFSPMGHTGSQQSTAKLKQLANINNDIDAQYLLGYRYEMGKSVKLDHNQAINWYRKAARKNHLDAQYRIGVLYFQQKEYEKARYWLAKRAKDGHADAQYYFANTFRYGLGTKEQTSTARKWFTKAAKQGHALAQYELGLQFQNGIGARKSQKTANKWFKLAADQGLNKAKTFLTQNTPHKPKIDPAKQFLQKNLRLARKGNVKAQYALGKSYLEGKNTSKDLKKSYYWFKKAANNKHKEAQYELGQIYIEGNTHTKKDLSKAKFWLSKAANNNHKKASDKLDYLAKLAQNERKVNQASEMINHAMSGDTEQQYELGMRYLLGYNIDIDNQQAIYWLNKAASQNHGLAQYQLANQYMKGNFVNQNIPRAIHFFASAAKQNIEAAKFALKHFSDNGFNQFVLAENGDKEAQYQLALSFISNKSQLKQKQGFKWLQLAANQSHPLALLKLGNLYQSGSIPEKNEVKAFEAYAKAAELNNAEAQLQLSQMYRLGIGTTQNPALASRWLSRAASQGHKEAQKALQFSEI